MVILSSPFAATFLSHGTKNQQRSTHKLLDSTQYYLNNYVYFLCCLDTSIRPDLHLRIVRYSNLSWNLLKSNICTLCSILATQFQINSQTHPVKSLLILSVCQSTTPTSQVPPLTQILYCIPLFLVLTSTTFNSH